MKTLKNTIAGTLLVLVAVSSFTLAHADEDKKTGAMKEIRSENKEMRSEMKAEWEVKHAEVKKARGENKDEMKENRKTWKEENKDGLKKAFSGLSEDDKAALKTIRTDHRAAVGMLKDTYSKDMSMEEKEAMMAEMKALHSASDVKTRELLEGNEAALEMLDKRDALKAKNQELREQNKEVRKEYRGKRSDAIEGQKTRFFAKIEAVLPKISDAKLEKINIRIASSIEKIEANESMDAERKAKYLDQLIGLKEIIEDAMESREVETEDTEIDDIISEALN